MKSCYVRNEGPAFLSQRFLGVWIKFKWKI
nr:MAG TPA: hypothetical protein [Caudoviricetes sp.]